MVLQHQRCARRNCGTWRNLERMKRMDTKNCDGWVVLGWDKVRNKERERPTNVPHNRRVRCEPEEDMRLRVMGPDNGVQLTDDCHAVSSNTTWLTHSFRINRTPTDRPRCVHDAGRNGQVATMSITRRGDVPMQCQSLTVRNKLGWHDF